MSTPAVHSRLLWLILGMTICLTVSDAAAYVATVAEKDRQMQALTSLTGRIQTLEENRILDQQELIRTRRLSIQLVDTVKAIMSTAGGKK